MSKSGEQVLCIEYDKFNNIGKVQKTNLELGRLLHIESNYLWNCMKRWVVIYYTYTRRLDLKRGFGTTNKNNFRRNETNFHI